MPAPSTVPGTPLTHETGVQLVASIPLDPAQSSSGQALAPDQTNATTLQREGPRSRRSLLTAGAVALGGAVAAGLASALPAEATGGNVTLGAANTETTPTSIKNTASAASATAFLGESTGAGAAAVQGTADGSNGVGVVGLANTGPNARGVFGHATQGIGVQGVGGHGVWGSGSYEGVHADATFGNGVNASGKVYGVSATGTTAGVNATSPGSSGIGLLASGGTYGAKLSGGTYGVYGSGGAYSFYAPQGGSYGIYANGSTSGADFFGGPWGVYGVGTSYGVEGIGTGGSGSIYGVYGYASTSGGTDYGVYGYGKYAGVYGSSAYVGTWGGDSNSKPVYGLVGYGVDYGLWCTAASPGWAVYAAGNVYVGGTLSKAAGAFKIDHPLDPERKWLSHSFVESPDMMNVYNGIAVLDGKGGTTVTLPKYFAVLNRDYRYQLTAIGGAAPSLHIAQKVNANRFKIAGGTPGLEVSWQVTGIRQDDYARAHPIVVETSKTNAERGSRQFVPAGSTAKLMNLGPRVADDTHSNQPPRQPGVHPHQP